MTDNRAASETMFWGLGVQEFTSTSAKIHFWQENTKFQLTRNHPLVRAYGPWDRIRVRSVQHTVLSQIATEWVV